MIRRILSGLLAVILCAFFWLAAVLTDKREDAQADYVVKSELADKIGRVSAVGASAADAFGLPVPLLSDTQEGVVRDELFGGADARVYEAFLTEGSIRVAVKAARPASAASLLGDAPDIISGDYTLCGLPAFLSGNDSTLCLTFLTDDACYLIAAEGMNTEDFLALASKLRLYQ